MIIVEIIEANSEDHLGKYDFHKNILYFGKNHDAEFYLPHSNLINNHIFIEIVENKLIVQLHKDVDFILVNKKRTTQFKHIKIGDILQLSDIKFRVLSFSTTENLNKNQFLSKRIKDIQENEPELMALVSSLSEEL
jgi:hypothetical protein